jgi:CubicO group peptidase (beta-lactamase class C family)
MIIQNGKVLLEQYELGNTPETRWLSMSMAKSFATTLIGCAIKDGFIGGQDDQLVLYLPQLRGSGYDGVSIRHLLQMTSGVEWDDTHTNSASHRRHMLVLQESMKPDAVLTYMASLPRVAQPGTVWNYSTGETHVVGALVKAATGKWLADYLSEKIWSQLGMEQDAHWWLESEGGLEVAGSGMTATLRDYVRFASFMLEGGGGILPENWIADATRVREAGGKPLPYGFMWWPVADNEGSFVDGAFSARGIFGQYLYINPARQIVIGVNSARAKPKFAEAILDNDFFNSVCRALA